MPSKNAFQSRVLPKSAFQLCSKNAFQSRLLQTVCSNCVPTAFSQLCSNCIFPQKCVPTVFQNCIPEQVSTNTVFQLCSNCIFPTVFQLHFPTKSAFQLCSKTMFPSMSKYFKKCVPTAFQNCVPQQVVPKSVFRASQTWFLFALV